MRKTHILLSIFLTLFLTVSTVSAITTVTVNLEYPHEYDPLNVDTEVFTLVSNTTPIFNFVASGGLETDVNISFLAEAGGTYYYQIYCNNISYRIDETFVNDTKTYSWVIFNLSTGSGTLSVNVDYSNVNTPGTSYNDLLDQISVLELQITNLEHLISVLESNNTNLSMSIIAKDSMINDLNAQITQLTNEKTVLETQRNELAQQNSELQTANTNLGTQIQEKISTIESRDATITSLDNQIIGLNNNIDKKDSTINQLEGIFTILYSKGEVDGLFHFNVFSAIIGAVIALVSYLIYDKQSNYSRKTLIDTISDKISGVPFLGTGTKRTPQEWDMIDKTDIRPTVEDEMLKDKIKVEPRTTEELNIDNIPEVTQPVPQPVSKTTPIPQPNVTPMPITTQPQPTPPVEPIAPPTPAPIPTTTPPITTPVEQVTQTQVPEKKPLTKSKSKSKKKKLNYWDTPAGKKRKEAMSKAASGL